MDKVLGEINELSTEEINANLEFLIGELFISGIAGSLSRVSGHIYHYLNPRDLKTIEILVRAGIKREDEILTQEQEKERALDISSRVASIYSDLPLSESEDGNPYTVPLQRLAPLIKRYKEMVELVLTTNSDSIREAGLDFINGFIKKFSIESNRFASYLMEMQRIMYERTGTMPDIRPAYDIHDNPIYKIPPLYSPS